MHSHGATLQEIFILRNGNFKRVVDVVIYPESHE
jgi:alkyldihydroxyacetonephosphate synthase